MSKAMLHVARKVGREDLSDPELARWLDEQFEADALERSGASFQVHGSTDPMREWGEALESKLPESPGRALFYLCRSTTGYIAQNDVGRVSMQHTWPLFFETFPGGQIWLASMSDRWFDEVWGGQRHMAGQTAYQKTHPTGLHPQEATGLGSDLFPFFALNLLACGIYPLLLCAHTHTTARLIFIYIPDKAIKHSQMLEGKTLYQEALWMLEGVFDDSLTSHGSGGPKSAADPDRLSPLHNLGYFEWFMAQVSARMSDIVAISDPFRREQLGMTANRAICDAHLCVTAQLPYMAKVLFFSCLDKLANLMLMLDMHTDEVEAWKRLLDATFITNEVLEALQHVPDEAGQYVRSLAEYAAEAMELDELSPDDMRDIRNSHHGYNLRPRIVARLMQKSGEFHNDITLIVTPLLLFFLTRKWRIA